MSLQVTAYIWEKENGSVCFIIKDLDGFTYVLPSVVKTVYYFYANNKPFVLELNAKPSKYIE